MLGYNTFPGDGHDFLAGRPARGTGGRHAETRQLWTRELQSPCSTWLFHRTPRTGGRVMPGTAGRGGLNTAREKGPGPTIGPGPLTKRLTDLSFGALRRRPRRLVPTQLRLPRAFPPQPAPNAPPRVAPGQRRKCAGDHVNGFAAQAHISDRRSSGLNGDLPGSTSRRLEGG